MPTLFETELCAIVSTAHMTKEDNEALEIMSDGKSISIVFLNGPVVYKKESGGYWIYVPLVGEEKEEENYRTVLSNAFVDLMIMVYYKGYQWLVMDCDGPEYDDIPKFEW